MLISPSFSFSEHSPRFIGITGGTGSGKTTFARALHRHVNPAYSVLLHVDDYYRDCSLLPAHRRQQVNFDHPDACDTPLLLTHLQALAAGQSVEVPRYDFATHTRLTDTRSVSPKSVIILEGLLGFGHSAIRDLLHLLVFVETPDDVRLIRRLSRDVQERGRTLESVVEQYLTTVRPMHQAFVEPARASADVVISGESDVSPLVEAVVSQLGARAPISVAGVSERAQP